MKSFIYFLCLVFLGGSTSAEFFMPRCGELTEKDVEKFLQRYRPSSDQFSNTNEVNELNKTIREMRKSLFNKKKRISSRQCKGKDAFSQQTHFDGIHEDPLEKFLSQYKGWVRFFETNQKTHDELIKEFLEKNKKLLGDELPPRLKLSISILQTADFFAIGTKILFMEIDFLRMSEGVLKYLKCTQQHQSHLKELEFELKKSIFQGLRHASTFIDVLAFGSRILENARLGNLLTFSGQNLGLYEEKFLELKKISEGRMDEGVLSFKAAMEATYPGFPFSSLEQGEGKLPQEHEKALCDSHQKRDPKLARELTRRAIMVFPEEIKMAQKFSKELYLLLPKLRKD